MRTLRAVLLFLILLTVAGAVGVFLWSRSSGPLPPPAAARDAGTATVGAPAATSSPPASSRAEAPGADLAQLRVPSETPDDRARRFYEARDRRIAWLDGSGVLNAAGQAMVEAVRHASDEGLEAADYEVEPFLGSTPPGAGAAPADLLDRDARLTSVFLRYASDVATGRVDPRAVHEDWHVPANEIDVVAIIGEALSQNRLVEALAQLPPPHPEYARLRQALAELRAEPSAPDARSVSAAAPHDRGTRARRAPASPPPLSVNERIRSVVLSMERWRWVPRQLEDPAIVINLPAFRLDVRENRQSVLAMRIVAGKSFSPTPVFSDAITSLIFHPAWSIPDRIARDEVLPEARRHPGYLQRQGIRALAGSGDHPREIDPASLRVPRPGTDLPFVLRQDPGPRNPLGRVKFVMPNEYDIYLHDTPAGGLFTKGERAFSHGCIRVEKPVELAAYLLQGTEWNRSRIASEMLGKGTREVRLARPVPVIILYMTAWVEEPGGLDFGNDIYGLDAELEGMLDRARAGRTATGTEDPHPRIG